MSVYLLQHVHSLENGDEDVKVVGVYSSREKAAAAILRLGQLPGFAESSSGFHIDEYRVDEDHWAEGFSVVGAAEKTAV